MNWGVSYLPDEGVRGITTTYPHTNYQITNYDYTDAWIYIRGNDNPDTGEPTYFPCVTYAWQFPKYVLNDPYSNPYYTSIQTRDCGIVNGYSGAYSINPSSVFGTGWNRQWNDGCDNGSWFQTYFDGNKNFQIQARGDADCYWNWRYNWHWITVKFTGGTYTY